MRQFEGEASLQEALHFMKAWDQNQANFELKTSGSTGSPKKITISRSQIQASIQASARALGLKKGQASLCCIHAQYIGGKMMLARALELDLSLHIIPPSANPFQSLLDIYPGNSLPKIDFSAFVPLQVLHMLKSADPAALAFLNRQEVIIIGGGSVSQPLLEKIQAIEAPVFSTYGMTETVSHIALRRLNGPNAQTYYQALSGVRLDKDERNCLKINAPQTRGEWIQTNDIVEWEGENSFYFLGRWDNVINSAGVKIHVEPLEYKLQSIFRELDIAQTFILSGLPDPVWGEALVLVLEGEVLPPKKETQLLAAIGKSTKKYEVPKKLLYLSRFPRTETDKINRKEILSQLIKSS